MPLVSTKGARNISAGTGDEMAVVVRMTHPMKWPYTVPPEGQCGLSSHDLTTLRAIPASAVTPTRRTSSTKAASAGT